MLKRAPTVFLDETNRFTADQEFQNTISLISPDGLLESEISIDDGFGRLILDQTVSPGTASYLDLRTSNADFGLIIRESDGTGTAAYGNITVYEGAPNYMNLVCNGSGQTSFGVVIDGNQRVTVGNTPNGTSRFFIDGSVDEEQLTIQQHSTQTANPFVVEDSAGTVLFNVLPDGGFVARGNSLITGDEDFVTLLITGFSTQTASMLLVRDNVGQPRLTVLDSATETVIVGDASAGDSVIEFWESGVLENKLYHDDSANLFKLEDGSANLLMDFNGNTRVRIHPQVHLLSGVLHKTDRVTTNTTLDTTYYAVFCDTDGGAITITLPVGEDGRTYRIINVGTSGNNVTIAPDGAELLLGANASQTLTDGAVAIITYETTEGWW